MCLYPAIVTFYKGESSSEATYCLFTSLCVLKLIILLEDPRQSVSADHSTIYIF